MGHPVDNIDNRYLHNGGENVGEGNEDKIVESCGIRNFGQILPGLQPEEGHREDSGDSCNTHRLSHNYNHTPCCCRTYQYLCLGNIFIRIQGPG